MTAAHSPGFSLAMVSTRQEYDHLFSIYVPIGLGVFAVITVAMLLAVVIYRRRPPEKAARWHENNALEGTYALLLALTAVFLLYLTFNAEHKVDTVSNHQPPALTVNVTGAKWEWTFQYPAYGFSVRSGTVGDQPLVVPANEAIRFNLTSVDVIHSFWVPALRYKHDLIPGSVQVTTLTFTRSGMFAGQCAEFCGLRHADMIFTVHAVSAPQFAAWARTRGRGPTP
ncbi:MAG: cytochrome c oxidase subunit II [Solirubrobacteraceae bacterium]